MDRKEEADRKGKVRLLAAGVLSYFPNLLLRFIGTYKAILLLDREATHWLYICGMPWLPGGSR